jgi:two-component system, OmpR family, response regulator QseB
MPRLLLVEDDRELGGLLDGLLREEGYDVDVAPDGQRGLHLGLTRSYDVIVLDRGLPAIEGLDLLGRLRSKGVVTPVLVLSARGNPADRVEGLDAGAEDYVSKPFDVEELLARLRGLLRRHVEHADVVRVPGGSLDVEAREVTLDHGDMVSLSGRETDVLVALARNPRRVFSRDELLESAFDDADDPGLVDTYVHYLRRKLGKDSVLTVRGVGYRLGRP